MELENIYNYLKINEKIITSGQPTAEQLQVAADNGVEVVVNLAVQESDTALEDEASIVRSLGLAYIHIPVAWHDPTTDDFEQFVTHLKENGDKFILIHCAANYRVTAFYSLYAMKILGWSEVQADALMAKIWDNDSYPVWEAFIQKIRRSF